MKKDMAGFKKEKKIPQSPPDQNRSLIPVRKSHCRGLSERRSVAENQHDLSQHAVLKMSFFLRIYRCFAVSFQRSQAVYSLQNSHVLLPWQGCHISSVENTQEEYF